MNIVVCKKKKQAVDKVCLILLKEIRKNPAIVLALASGKTMNQIYGNFINKFNNEADFSKLKIFMIDEFINEKNISLENSVFREFVKPLGIKTEQVKFIRDFEKSPKNYENEIKKSGGIDFILLGIGENGHIAFNEPNSSEKSTTRKINLSKKSIEQIKISYHKRNTSKNAITIGLATIFASKKIVLAAFGKAKAKAIFLSTKCKISKKVPASILQKHPNVKIIIDEAAASLL